MANGKEFFGGFIDEHDSAAVERWSAGFCDGLDVAVMAERYGVEPTVEAVARHISGKFPSDTREVSFLACVKGLEGKN